MGTGESPAQAQQRSPVEERTMKRTFTIRHGRCRNMKDCPNHPEGMYFLPGRQEMCVQAFERITGVRLKAGERGRFRLIRVKTRRKEL